MRDKYKNFIWMNIHSVIWVDNEPYQPEISIDVVSSKEEADKIVKQRNNELKLRELLLTKVEKPLSLKDILSKDWEVATYDNAS